MGNIKQINIKIGTYFFFNDMINIKKIDSGLLKLDKKSYKNIDIYYIRYITIKNLADYESIHIVHLLYLIVGRADGYSEEKNGNRYLIFASTDKNKKDVRKVHRTLG